MSSFPPQHNGPKIKRAQTQQCYVSCAARFEAVRRRLESNS